MKFCWDGSQLSSTETKNWEKLKITKSDWLDPLFQDMYQTKSLLQSQFVVKKASFTIGSIKHIANQLNARKLGRIESSFLYQKTCIAYTYNLPHWHFSQLHRKKFLIFLGFVNKSNTDNFPSDYMSCPIDATQCGHQGCKINWIFQWQLSRFNLNTNNRKWKSGRWDISRWVDGL